MRAQLRVKIVFQTAVADNSSDALDKCAPLFSHTLVHLPFRRS
jgi:hypothetical protein